jgi:hypothetical protein
LTLGGKNYRFCIIINDVTGFLLSGINAKITFTGRVCITVILWQGKMVTGELGVGYSRNRKKTGCFAFFGKTVQIPDAGESNRS